MTGFSLATNYQRDLQETRPFSSSVSIFSRSWTHPGLLPFCQLDTPVRIVTYFNYYIGL
eukprot:m.215272 g.215272  ORF g.215272 m.215272 type:complete len:59 (-) comp16973_c7_seq2:335-511(-)